MRLLNYRLTRDEIFRIHYDVNSAKLRNSNFSIQVKTGLVWTISPRSFLFNSLRPTSRLLRPRVAMATVLLKCTHIARDKI